MSAENYQPHSQPLSILLVEDDPNDIFIFQSAVAALDGHHLIHIATDADAALSLLGTAQPGSTSLQPSLIILDINLPGMNGLELLSEIRQFPRYRTTSIIIMSTSRTDKEVEEAYARGASFYVAKPFDFITHMQVARDIVSFWSRVVRLPRRSRRTPLPEGEVTTP